jgi:hypothetical protein
MSDLHVIEFTEGCAVYKQHKVLHTTLYNSLLALVLLLLIVLAMAACIRDNSNIRNSADNTCSLRDERLWSVFTAIVTHQ